MNCGEHCPGDGEAATVLRVSESKSTAAIENLCDFNKEGHAP
jgi:hypothetical protein